MAAKRLQVPRSPLLGSGKAHTFGTLNCIMAPTKNGTSQPVLEPKERKSPSITKEELGRATWALLHMIAAQYPDEPTVQSECDATDLMHIISRIYPCRECADHFKEILRENPVQAGSKEEFSHWLCHVHNIVNESLGKKKFPCDKVKEKWVRFGCEGDECEGADE